MDALAPFPRGKTYYGSTDIRPTAPTNGATDPYGPSVKIEGIQNEFPDYDPVNSRAGGVRILRSERKVICQLVRNVSGITLQPGMAVKWLAGSEGKRVDGYTNTTAQEAAGIVDDLIPCATGVPTNDLFWLVIQGPCLVYGPYDAGVATWTVGADLYAVTATASQQAFLSNVSLTNTSAATDNEGRLTPWGGTFTATQTTDGTAAKIVKNRIGIAMTANTNGATDACKRVLVDVVLKAR